MARLNLALALLAAIGMAVVNSAWSIGP